MKTTRKDRLGRVLRTGEEQLRDGRYRFRGKGATRAPASPPRG